MKQEIIELEQKLIEKASWLIKEWNVLESMKFYSLLLDLPWSEYWYNTEFMLKIVRYYIDILEHWKALEITEKALKISWWDMKLLKQKKEILIYMWRKEMFKEVDEQIALLEGNGDEDISDYLELVNDAKVMPDSPEKIKEEEEALNAYLKKTENISLEWISLDSSYENNNEMEEWKMYFSELEKIFSWDRMSDDSSLAPKVKYKV